MKTKITSLALLIAAGLLSSTVTASAYTTYGNTVVNGTTYNLSPFADLTAANLSYATLSDANLSYATLSFAYLYNADLSYADLTGATVSYSNWTDFSNNSGAQGLGSYSYDTSLINYAGSTPVPEPSTYGLIGVAALGVAFAARRRKLKTA